MSDPRYPIGKFNLSAIPTADDRTNLISDIDKAPTSLRTAVQGLTSQQIETALPRWRLDGQAGSSSCA
jgi:hypothetical protein